MMDEDNASSKNSITIKLKVYMHCDSCERSVRRAIRKVEGVETIEVDRDENKVTVTGDFEPEKVLKKIKKKTGKKAEILIPEETEEECKGEEPYVPYDDSVLYPDADVADEYQNYGPERWNFRYFDDENTEACMSITIKLKVYMHCDSCERSVRRAIRKVEGVETIEVDRDENKVTVTGDFEPEKVLKKIKKKTGKKAEILIPEETEEECKGEEPYVPYDDSVLYPDADVADEYQNYGPERWNFRYFDDENTEACMVM